MGHSIRRTGLRRAEPHEPAASAGIAICKTTSGNFMEFTNDRCQEKPPMRNWLEATLRRLNFLAAMRERRQIRSICIEFLSMYRQVKVELPQASPTELYARIIEKRSGAGPATAVDVSFGTVLDPIGTGGCRTACGAAGAGPHPRPAPAWAAGRRRPAPSSAAARAA